MAKSDLDIMGGLTEFLALADRLEMPESERQGIFGVSEDGWEALAAHRIDLAVVMTAEFRRRLDYILPLMRKAVTNREQAVNGRSNEMCPPNQLLS